jgi:Type II secretion system (T2SS), protein M subtype b
VASELPALRARVAELRAAAHASRADFFGGDSDAIATANLQKRVGELATSVGAVIASSENLPAEPRGASRRIGIRVALHDDCETACRARSRDPAVGYSRAAYPQHDKADIRSKPWGIETVFDVYGFRQSDAPTALPEATGATN